MKLYLDVGNSRIKWLVSGEAVANIADSLEMLAAQWRGLSGVETVSGVNVRGKDSMLAIDALAMKQFKQKINWRLSSKAAGGVRNAYAVPANLGSDRWLTLMAARARCPNAACIIIDAGTAITVDLLDESGQHRGGAIMPGLSSMLAAIEQGKQLRSSAHKLKDGLLDSTPQAAINTGLASDTQSAILTGVMFAANGGVMALIKQQSQAINAKMQAIEVFITGGDALKLGLDGLNLQHIPNLVIEGLQTLENESNAQPKKDN